MVASKAEIIKRLTKNAERVRIIDKEIEDVAKSLAIQDPEPAPVNIPESAATPLQFPQQIRPNTPG